MEKQSITSFQEFSDERFTKRVIYKKEESTAFVLNFKPGQELPAHKHPGTGLYLFVLQGGGTLTVDGTATEISKDDVIYCEGNETFSFKNTTEEETSFYVMLNKIPEEKYAQDI